MIITVDGPTASGKGSVARALADMLGMYYLDTGLLYRAIGYVVSLSYTPETVRNISCLNADIIAAIVQDLSYLYENGSAHVLHKGHDVTSLLRTPEIDWYASHTSQIGAVRDGVKALQRQLGSLHNLVADGRDCGTVTFAHASHKFFLTASLHQRACRVGGDAKRKNDGVSLAVLKREIMARDMRDITRAMSPLTPAPDAIILDNSHLTKEETLTLIRSYIHS